MHGGWTENYSKRSAYNAMNIQSTVLHEQNVKPNTSVTVSTKKPGPSVKVDNYGVCSYKYNTWRNIHDIRAYNQ